MPVQRPLRDYVVSCGDLPQLSWRPSPLRKTVGDIRVSERHGADEAIEWFKSLDGMALHRCSKTLPNGAVEIDEDPRPQQLVHLIDARFRHLL
jgi:hypothetical protein